MAINIPCKCGHEKEAHNSVFTFCMSYVGFDLVCNCNEYRHDNLKYLEQIYEALHG